MTSSWVSTLSTSSTTSARLRSSRSRAPEAALTPHNHRTDEPSAAVERRTGGKASTTTSSHGSPRGLLAGPGGASVHVRRWCQRRKTSRSVGVDSADDRAAARTTRLSTRARATVSGARRAAKRTRVAARTWGASQCARSSAESAGRRSDWSRTPARVATKASQRTPAARGSGTRPNAPKTDRASAHPASSLARAARATASAVRSTPRRWTDHRGDSCTMSSHEGFVVAIAAGNPAR